MLFMETQSVNSDPQTYSRLQTTVLWWLLVLPFLHSSYHFPLNLAFSFWHLEPGIIYHIITWFSLLTSIISPNAADAKSPITHRLFYVFVLKYSFQIGWIVLIFHSLCQCSLPCESLSTNKTLCIWVVIALPLGLEPPIVTQPHLPSQGLLGFKGQPVNAHFSLKIWGHVRLFLWEVKMKEVLGAWQQ